MRRIVTGFFITAIAAAIAGQPAAAGSGADERDCDVVYKDSPAERAVCRQLGPVAPDYRQCLFGGKLMGVGFLQRHVGCLNPSARVGDAVHFGPSGVFAVRPRHTTASFAGARYLYRLATALVSPVRVALGW